jgi:predicted dehydrogenase
VDANPGALEARTRPLREAGAAFATYAAEDFDRMVAETRPETVLVTSPDHTHADYVCRAMDLGCDVVVEKPLTTTAEDCRRILQARRRTGRACRVALNYRYAPWNRSIKELAVAGVAGRIVSVAMRKSLPMHRGASYFHRWHGQQDRSGGLLVHKITHYFDLANFFLADVPATVYARGGQQFFTAAEAERLGLQDRGARCAACPVAARCPYFHDVATGPETAEVVEARGAASGYYRDACVFRPEADANDTMHLVIAYEGGVLLNYSFVAVSEGGSDSVLFGTRGRLVITGPALRVVPYYGEPYEVHPPKVEGHHGGADPAMFAAIFDPAGAADDPLGCAADERDGAYSVLVGLAANESMATGRPVVLKDLVPELERPAFVAHAPEPADSSAERMRAWEDAQLGRAT